MATHGTFPSLPTAMHDDGSLDRDAQAALAATNAAAGAAGVCVLGLTSGEPAELDADERAAVIRAAREGAAGLPVAAGLGPPGPGTLASAQRAAGAGADVLVVPVPPAALRAERLGEIAALGLPVWLHHHPVATGAQLDEHELLALAVEVGAAAIVLDAAPSPDLAAVVAAERGPAGLGGLSALFLPEELEAGAAGTVAGSAVPERLVDVVARHQSGDPSGAREAYAELLAYLRLEVGSPSLRVRKEAWRQRGVLSSARVRRGAPLGTATRTAITRRLREVGAPVTDPYPGA